MSTGEIAHEEQKLHIVTVACACAEDGKPCTCEAEGEDHDWEIKIECPYGPGEGRPCVTWWSCLKCQDAMRAGDSVLRDQLDATSQAHGEEHYHHHDVGWATEGNDCWVQACDDLPDAVDALFPTRDGGMRPGRFLVTIDDGDPLILALVSETDSGEPRG